MNRLANIIIAVLLTGCGSHELSGVVRDKPTGNPVANATVSIGEHTASTDGMGRYTLEWKGKPHVTVNASGYHLYSGSLIAAPGEDVDELVRDYELAPR